MNSLWGTKRNPRNVLLWQRDRHFMTRDIKSPITIKLTLYCAPPLNVPSLLQQRPRA
jgi:hypothetical protein